MGLEALDPGTLALVLCAGLAAGWIDAVVGGGGLIQLPAVLMLPGLTPVQALATNKLGSVFGTATSALTYFRRTPARIRPALPMAAVAFGGSFGGASTAAMLPVLVFKPIILVALVGVAAFTVFAPGAGQLDGDPPAGWREHAYPVLIGLGLGFYDGVLGPGTGSFLIISLITLMGMSFLRASAHAKVVNTSTNLGALLFFSLHGSVLPALGLVLGLANMCGGYLGARSAVARGSTFIRVVFLVVVSALILKTGADLWQQLGR